MTKKQRTISALVTGFAVSFYFMGVLPIQSYLANADTFTYTLGALVKDLVLPFCLTYVFLAALFYIVSRWLGTFLHLLSLSIVVAALVESGPLSAGLPELNGDFSGYHLLSRSLLDGSLLFALIIVPLICYRRLRSSIIWIAIGIAFYSTSTLFDVRVKSQRPEGMEDFIVPRLIPRTEVVSSSEFSFQNNAILIILDSISVDACRSAFERDHDLAAHYQGFVNYTNNVGMMWPTYMAIPGIFTGKYCETLDQLQRYSQLPWMDASFIKSYLDWNIPVYVNFSLSRDGYTNRPKLENERNVPCNVKHPIQERMFGLYPMTIAELSLFRLMPYCAKASFVSSLGSSFETDSDVSETINEGQLEHDAHLWKLLSEKTVNPSFPMTMHVHHTMGGHPPFTLDRNGRSLPAGNESYAAYVEQCIYALRQVGSMFDAWSTNGVYDASTIVIIADHGIHLHSKDWPKYAFSTVSDSRMFPCLMVKARQARGAFRSSSLATSHARIAPLFSRLAREELTESDISDVLHTDLRRAVSINPTTRKKTEWTFSADQLLNCDTTELQAAELTPLRMDHHYSFKVDPGQERFLNFKFDGGKGGWIGGAEGARGEDMRFTFMMPDANSKYDFKFWIKPTPKGVKGTLTVSSGTSRISTDYDNTSGFRVRTVTLPDVGVSSNNLIEIRIKRDSQQGALDIRGMKVHRHDDEMPKPGDVLAVCNVDIKPSVKDGYNRFEIPYKWQCGKSYALYIPQGTITAGHSGVVEARLQGDGSNDIVDFCDIPVTEDGRVQCFCWRFTVPTRKGEYHCFIYAGSAGNTIGNGLKIDKVLLTERQE